MLCGLLEGLDLLAKQGIRLDRRFLLTGGAARSKAFRQILADLTGKPIWVATIAEAAAAGAAVQADLGIALRQLVEIAVAVHRNMRFLLLDEPTASLEIGQVYRLFDWLRNLAQREKVGTLLIGHKLNEMLAVSDRITALIDGRIALSNSVDAVTRADLISAITGKATVQGIPKGAGPTQRTTTVGQENPALIVRGLQTVRLSGVDLTARPGRVLGLYGLVGSGRSRFLRSLIGLEQLAGGSIMLFGRS